MPPTTPIIDAHVHQWDPRNTPRPATPAVKLFGWNPWLLERVVRLAMPTALVNYVGKAEHALNPYLPRDLEKDWAEHASRLQGVVHVQAVWEIKRHRDVADETRWLDRIDPLGKTILGIVGAAHLEAPDLPEVLDAHAEASTRFRGVRDMLASHPKKTIVDFAREPDLIRNPAWHRGYEALGKRGLSFDAWMYHHQIDEFTDIAKSAPDTRFVLCHLGTPIAVAGEFGGLGRTPVERKRTEEAWKASLARIAEIPHACFKLSGLLMPIVGFGAEHRSNPMTQREFVDRVGPFLEYAIDTIGLARCMFGSNFPMDKVSIDYAPLVSSYDELLSTRTDEERARFFSGLARDFYGIAGS